MQPREARHGVDDPALGALTEPDGDLDIWLPQVPLGELAGPIARCAGTDQAVRTAGAIRAPALSGPSSRVASRSARRSPSPASTGTPATSHGSRRPPRRPSTQPAPVRTSAPSCERNAVRTVFRAIPSRSSDRPDTHLLRPMKPADLRPVLHVDHPPNPLTHIAPGNEIQHSNPPRRVSSSGDSSTTATAGAQRERLPAQVLRQPRFARPQPNADVVPVCV